MALCLVAGGAGFIGSRLVEALIRRGDRVRVLDNFSTGRLTNLDNVRHEAEIVFGDLNNRDLLQQVVQGVEVFFQLTAPAPNVADAPELAAKWAHPSETLHALMAGFRAKVRRFVYASSCNVYGRSPMKEDSWVVPDSAYGMAKLAGELQCVGFTSLYGMETVRLRYSETYGMRQSPASPYAQTITAIVKAMLAGAAPALDEAASEPRDYIALDDVVQATLLAADAPRVSGQVYNIARGRPVTVLEIVETINLIRGTKLQLPRPRSLIPPFATRCIDNSRAERELGFCPSMPLRQGLLSLVEYQARQGEAAATTPEKTPDPDPEPAPVSSAGPNHDTAS
ncbi:MAG: NAD-dependent epimerase/dehydratase family protein [Gemmataceae bacterium]|nr:NAD-dependent epimerase/dehydratase family protein [Gemmataceae bacterium]